MLYLNIASLVTNSSWLCLPQQLTHSLQRSVFCTKISYINNTSTKRDNLESV